jgi:hypothetical protein
MPTAIIGGLAFTRDTQPTVMKFALPIACVPSSTTGMGKTNAFVPSDTFSIICTCYTIDTYYIYMAYNR